MTTSTLSRVIPSPSPVGHPERSEGSTVGFGAGSARDLHLWSAILRVPLIGKLIGANLVLFVSAFAMHELFPAASSTLQLAIPLMASFAVTTLLVWLALRPVAQLEEAAGRVARGDFTVRVKPSPLADRNMLRLSVTLNRLLDRVEGDRARIQYLAGRSVRARDIERESVARELRDTFAQMVSAIALQVAAAQRVNDNAEVEQQLERARALIVQLTEDMRSIAETLYPGTLGEFGLLNAIHALVRRTSRQVPVKIEVGPALCELPALAPQAASALYRTADEVLRNIAQHADAKHARITMRGTKDEVILEVEDDGRGQDMRVNDPLQAGLGLFSAKAVLALAGGSLQISSAPGLGTRVIARVPTGSLTGRS